MLTLCNLVKGNEGSLGRFQRSSRSMGTYITVPQKELREVFIIKFHIAQHELGAEEGSCMIKLGLEKEIRVPRLRGVFWTETKDKARTRMPPRRLVAWTGDSQGQNSHALTKDLE